MNKPFFVYAIFSDGKDKISEHFTYGGAYEAAQAAEQNASVVREFIGVMVVNIRTGKTTYLEKW